MYGGLVGKGEEWVLCHNRGEVYASVADEDFRRHLRGVVLKGDRVAVAVCAGRAGEAVACGDHHRLVFAEEPIKAVGVLHDGSEFALGEGADLDAFGRFTPIPDSKCVSKA